MNIEYIIQLLNNKLNTLNLAKDQAFQVGDLERINAVNSEILEVQNTLSKLGLISTIEQTAIATNSTATEVVKNGIEATFNPTVITDATKCLLSFNIEPYATDPDHELKIQSILEKMGLMNSPEQIEIYLRKTSPNSPLTGAMIYGEAVKYNVDTRLLMALMQQDSSFGTEGVGARTFNPGNVGNTGSAERTFPSWQDGVAAVAIWLDGHRRNDTVIPAETSSEENSDEDNSTEDEEEENVDTEDSKDIEKETESVPTNIVDEVPETPKAVEVEPVENATSTVEATTTPEVVEPAIEEPAVVTETVVETSPDTSTSTVE